MAMAYLFSEYFKTFPGIRLGGYPIQAVHAIVVDHGLRPGSLLEASQVTKSLNRMGIRGHLRSLRWKELRAQGVEPSELPNIESLSRKLRYWWLGVACRELLSPFLFTAHHRDDQYETVLMRLLSGHTYRGLQGMRKANDIPETEGLYGVHKSGLLRDQRSNSPSLFFRPTLRQNKALRKILRSETIPERAVYSWTSLDSLHFHDGTTPPKPRDQTVPYLTPLDTEDGGVTVYRPLLDFDKDRLRATCEANKVPWFEDHTNEDETMTTRNAVRHLVKYYNVPSALQKPSLLALRDRSQRRLHSEESEARRLLVRGAVARSFDPCAGTLIIEVPRFTTGRTSVRRHDEARAELRIPHRRFVAALAIRNLIDFVTPEKNLPSLPALNVAVDRLFPELTSSHAHHSRPAAFSIGHVLFEPVIRAHSVKWHLSRAPYKATASLPKLVHIRANHRKCGEASDPDLTETLLDAESRRKPRRNKVRGWCDWTMPQLWDGRYWISLTSCVADRFLIRPYSPDLARDFRASLAPEKRVRLEKLLKTYAPGKVRTTLPALYRSDDDTRDPDARLTMLALPTLGIHVHGLDRWIRCDISYKKVDTTLLGRQKRHGHRRLVGYQAAIGVSRSRRIRRLRTREAGEAVVQVGQDEDLCLSLR